MKIEEKTITPEVASFMLSKNLYNRQLRPRVVERYAKDIIENRWQSQTGETIKISTIGTLLDGQHRLHAIVKANKPVVMTIASEIDESAFEVIDTGAKRTGGDALHFAGVKNGQLLSGIIQAYNSLNNDLIHAKSFITNTEVVSEYNSNKSFWDNVGSKTTVWYSRFTKIFPPRLLGAFYAIAVKKNAIEVEAFLNELTTGYSASNIVTTLRDKLIKNKLSVAKFSDIHALALIIKGYNFYLIDKSRKIVNYEPEKESFPKIN